MRGVGWAVGGPSRSDTIASGPTGVAGRTGKRGTWSVLGSSILLASSHQKGVHKLEKLSLTSEGEILRSSLLHKCEATTATHTDGHSQLATSTAHSTQERAATYLGTGTRNVACIAFASTISRLLPHLEAASHRRGTRIMGNSSSTPSATPAPPAQKVGIKSGKKICCCCPETKQARDACILSNGEEDKDCQRLIELHKECLRSEGFDVK